jgi:hypothetical protein
MCYIYIEIKINKANKMTVKIIYKGQIKIIQTISNALNNWVLYKGEFYRVQK